MRDDTGHHLFTPEAETERRFKARVAALLNGQRVPDSIDMGRLPAVYAELGIVDTKLKTNATTVFKALGLKGKNRHHVPKETLENLLALVHDPVAVFKSLSTSDNPKSYVAILAAKAADGKPVIAILRPSEDGKGYTFIPSLYERNKYENFIENTRKEGRALYVKEKGSELWGRLQSPPRHNAEPYINSILTKEDIVKRSIERGQNTRARQAGFIQGVCECANIVKEKDITLAQKLLKQFDVTRETARKYAGPKTFNEMQADIYAPKQKQKRGRGI